MSRTELIGKPYRPSNGTEGDIFMGGFCDHCAKDNRNEKIFCNIIVLSMCNYTDSPDYPKEWIYDQDGEPTCTAFEPNKDFTGK